MSLQALTLVAAALAGPAAGRVAQGNDESRAVHSFSIPDTLHARTLHAQALEHLRAKRFGEAQGALQQLLENHRGAVLAPRDRDDAGRRSEHACHPGASAAALETLLGLDAAARGLYRERHESGARARLDALLSAPSIQTRRELSELARRFPLTLASQDAWIALGDLDFELGNHEQARLAWARAQDWAARLGDGDRLGERRLGWLDPSSDGELDAPAHGELALENGSGEIAPIPGSDCHTWRQRIAEDSPFYPFSGGGADGPDTYNLFPVLADDTVLVSNTLRVFAFNAYSGALRWKSDEAPGWRSVDEKKLRVDNKPLSRRDFFQGLNRAELMAAPAAYGSIAVAALQIPVTQLYNTNYQNITITTVMPDRRLFAFDVASGQPIWNHLPPPLWDGESGSFAERMRVAGPPVIAGGRVLVPAYRMQGRIEYHVACFDLTDGSLMWSTALISGQLELNMFGRQNRELATPPLCVDGERVIAQTQLGALAALDLFTGDILWETLYDQIPLPAAEGYQAGDRDEVWRNAPPVVSDGTVIAAPADSYDLVAFDVEQGTLLWSRPQMRLARNFGRRGHFALLGATDDTIYLGGGEIVSVRAASGLDSPRGPTETMLSEALAGEALNDMPSSPRALLAGDHVVVPTGSRRIALNRRNLRTVDPQATAPWSDRQSAGNLLVGKGALYSLSGRYLTGLCDWTSLEERLERDYRADPADHERALAFARFLQDRAEIDRREGKTTRARDALERASAALESLLVAHGEPQAVDRGALGATRIHEVQTLVHGLLVDQARAALDLADPDRALALLERSRASATTPEQSARTLLGIATLTRERDPDRWTACLEELAHCCASHTVPSEALGQGGGDSPTAETLREMPIGLWAERELARSYRRRGDLARELELLHRLLAHHGDVVLDDAVAVEERASARIGAIVGQRPPPEYAPFEARAAALLESARDQRDLEALARVAELFPHSMASAQAAETSFELAAQAGDVELFAPQVLGFLPDDWSIDRATTAQVRALLRLIAVIERADNRVLAGAMLRALARSHPRATSDLGDQAGRTLAELAAATSPPAPTARESDRATFDAGADRKTAVYGQWTVLGAVELGGASSSVLVCSTQGVVMGFDSSDPLTQRWSAEVDRKNDTRFTLERAALGDQRVVLALASELVTLQAHNGAELRRHSFGDDTIEALARAPGLTLVTTGARRASLTLTAIENQTGARLWSREIGPGFHPRPLVGDACAVMLPSGGSTGGALAIDLFTGKRARVLDLGGSVRDNDQRAAWVDGDLLVLPTFPFAGRAEEQLARAWSLASGELAWTVPADPERELTALVRAEGRDYFVLVGRSRGGRASAGAILELDPKLGSTRAVPNARLAPEDQLIGVERLDRTHLDAALLFVRSSASGSNDALIRAVHLPYGERWAFRLPTAVEDLYNGDMPMPALSQTTVALAYSELPRGRGASAAGVTQLVLLDRTTGQKRDLRTLERTQGPADGIELAAFGPALIVAGAAHMEVLTR